MSQGEILVPEPEVTEADVDAEVGLLCLRLREAIIYRDHLRSLLRSWAMLSLLGWGLTFGALTVAIWSYLRLDQQAPQVPDIISAVGAFVVVIAVFFAVISSYRLALVAHAVSEATLRTKHARVVTEALEAENSQPLGGVARMSGAKLPAVVRKISPAEKVEEARIASNRLITSDSETRQLIEVPKRLDALRSSVLAGILGAAIGLPGFSLLGLVLGIALPATFAAGGIGLLAGAALAILRWRGRDRWRFEKILDHLKMGLVELDERIARLKKEIDGFRGAAPANICEQMWEEYSHLRYQRTQIEARIADAAKEFSGS
jgi:hypothetical protein